MKTIVAMIFAVAVGAVAGAFVVQHRLGPELRDAQAACGKLEQEAAQNMRDAQRANERLAALEPKLDALMAERDTWREQLKTPQPAVSDTTGEEPAAGELAEAAALIEPEQANPNQAPPAAATVQQPDERREDRREQRWRDPEARRQFMTGMRERSQGYLQERIASTNDPVVQERLRSIGEYLDYMMDLGSQMGDAQSEEERQELRQTMDETRQGLQTLVQEQQDFMARDLAKQYGITDEDKQDQFVGSLTALRDSPFFNSRLMQGGPGRPWHGGPSFMGSSHAAESPQGGQQ